MPKRRDILSIVLIVIPWTLLITVWHQGAIPPLPAFRKDDGVQGRQEAGGQGQDCKENCPSKYVYRRPPPWSNVLPIIYIITPTYSRLIQKAELTRQANTFLNVPNLHWIVVEDSERKTSLVRRLLRQSGLNYTHLNVESPVHYRSRGDIRIPRGTMQRNLALRWLRETFNPNSSQAGVVYFADDDNTYTLELFEEMRWTQKVSVWPVAFSGGVRFESVKVNAAGKVYGWKVLFDPGRPFAIDMAGFAINLRLILFKPHAYFKLLRVRSGYQETSLLQQLVTFKDLEPKAANCTKILVWHTKSRTPRVSSEGQGFADPNAEMDFPRCTALPTDMKLACINSDLAWDLSAPDAHVQIAPTSEPGPGEALPGEDEPEDRYSIPDFV